MSLLFQGIEKAYELFEQKEFEQSLETVLKVEQMLGHGSNGEKLSEDEANEILSSLENFKGFNYLALDQVGEAREAFERSLNINPNSSQACAGMGEVFYLLERDEEAKVMYEWSFDNNPSNQFAVAGLAKVNRRLGLPDNHNTLNLETTLKSKDSFYKLLSEAYKQFTDKEYEESLVTLAQVEKIFNKACTSKTTAANVVSLENFKGFNYLALNHLDLAQAAFERALNINPASSQSCAGLAEIFFLQGKEKESKSMFEWAVKHNPANGFAIEGLKKVNKALKLPEKDNSLIQ